VFDGGVLEVQSIPGIVRPGDLQDPATVLPVDAEVSTLTTQPGYNTCHTVLGGKQRIDGNPVIRGHVVNRHAGYQPS
jgi:hypothetical protein